MVAAMNSMKAGKKKVMKSKMLGGIRTKSRALKGKLPIAKRAKKVENRPWPAKELFFKRWSREEAWHLVHDVLVERGWKYRGEPADREDVVNTMNDIVKGKYWSKDACPKRCLWLLEAPEMINLRGIPGGADRHRFSTFRGTAAACWKTTFTEKFRGEDFWPASFILPGEKKQMLAHLRTPAAKNEYWIAKPKNDYAGRGVVPYCNGPELEAMVRKPRTKQYVAQSYITNPILCGPYKSHMRVYMAITNLKPLRAFMHHEGCVMFATKPYKCSPDNVGKNYDKLSHITNYSFNATEKNIELFCKNKPVIGTGTLWSISQFLNYIQKHHGIDKDASYQQIANISREVARHVSNFLKNGTYPHAPNAHFELFGLDMLMDDTGKVWLMEGNNSVGLDYCGDHCGGKKNPDSKAADAVTKLIVHDLHALLGVDAETGYKKQGKISGWFDLNDEE